MPEQRVTVDPYFKSLNILHFALIAGQVLFALIAFGVQKAGVFGTNEPVRSVLVYMVPAFALCGIVAGNILYKKQVSTLKEKELSGKLEGYRAAMITRDALLEGPSLFAIMSFLLTGELLFLAVTAVVILIFLYVRPRKSTIIKDLSLSSEETMTIDDNNNILK